MSDRFIGKQQWVVFFVVSFFGNIVFFAFLSALFGIDFITGFSLAMLSFFFISSLALLKGYMFFANHYPDCQDVEERRFYAVPEKHAALVEINGVYPEKPLHAGWYFIFPFFNFITFSQTIFLGDFNGVIFDGGDDNKIDFDNGISTPVEAMYVAHLYSGPELGADLKTAGKTKEEIEDIEDTISILASILDKDKAEVAGLTINRELKALILDNSIKRYAKEEKADDNISEMLRSLLRLTLGSQSSDAARKDKVDLKRLKEEDRCVFNSIIKHYGVDIRSVNIADIKLSEEEIKINRVQYEAQVNLKVAEDKKKTAVIEAEAEAKVMELKGEGLEKQIKSIVATGASAKEVLEYLTKMEQWKSMKATDKSFIIDNGGSIAGILAAIGSIKP